MLSEKKDEIRNEKGLNIVFASNYMSIHQLYFSLSMYNIKNVKYTFVATSEIPKFRLKSGYIDLNHSYDFIICAYENEENRNKAIDLCTNCDVLITGSAPEMYISNRMKLKKLTFRYSERIYRKKSQFFQIPLRAIKYHLRDKLNPNVYMLCNSAYAASDYNKTLNYIGKTYKWGYFPEVKEYENIDTIMENKKKNSILWVARLIELKHPEMVIELAKRLKEEKYEFVMNLIGGGELENKIKENIKENHLEEYVNVLGAVNSKEVRKYMEESEIFLFTSDRREGWGAVLNESMNSLCAVVASHEIGSVPFLIKDKENGLIFKDKNINDLYEKVKYLLNNPIEREKISRNAYQTMVKDWSPQVASERIIVLSNFLLNKDKNNKAEPFSDGICSKAKKLKDNWYLKASKNCKKSEN